VTSEIPKHIYLECRNHSALWHSIFCTIQIFLLTYLLTYLFILKYIAVVY